MTLSQYLEDYGPLELWSSIRNSLALVAPEYGSLEGPPAVFNKIVVSTVNF